MRVYVVTPPAPIITVTEAKQHLKVLHDDEDSLIAGYLGAAIQHLDGPTGWLGRALGRQTLEARLDHFDCGSIVLPYPPHVSITSVRYLNDAGTEVIIAPTDYELLAASLLPAMGATWPSAARRREAVRVRYVAGYEEVPMPVRAAVLLMTEDLYRHRGSTASGAAPAVEMSTTVEKLLAPLRVFA